MANIKESELQDVNFITAHDGFTLNDLVSYNYKHNEANGEGNRDGNDNNLSWNCGVEGETDDPGIEALRKRHPLLQRSRFFTGQLNQRGLADISWHGCRLNSPGWYDPNSSVLGFTMCGFDGDADLHVMLNMDWQNLDFDIPSIEGRK